MNSPFVRILVLAIACSCLASVYAQEAALKKPATRKQAAPAVAAPTGSLLIMGGCERFTNAEIWSELIQLAGGPKKQIAVIPTASANPQRDGDDYVRVLQEYGAEAFLAPVAIKGLGVDYKVAVHDPALVLRVKQSQGVLFLGGDQGLIRKALVEPEGHNTPLLDAIGEVYRGGGVIAGTSAGAAVMSRVMYRDPDPVFTMLANGCKMGKDVDLGLGFLDRDWFVEQHCLARGRFARAIVAMRSHCFPYGIGIDEDTAVVVANGKQARVIGSRGVLIIDSSRAVSSTDLRGFNLKHVKLHYLERGDAVDLGTREVTLSPEKLAGRKVDPLAPNFMPNFEQHLFYNDILGPSTLTELMVKLIDGKFGDAIGLAFDGLAARSAPTRGFEFHFRRERDSVGYHTEASGGDDYSVLNIYLDIRPIEVHGPLYRDER